MEAQKAFVKEVMAEITEDQPHYNTLSTIVRNLEEKRIAHNAYGKTHQYYTHHCYRGLQKRVYEYGN
jgi:hypothetical protein